MNFGDCPYDDCQGVVSVAVPERTPAYTMIVCEECGRDVWYRCSRWDPQAWTREAFEAEHVIDQERKTIVSKAALLDDEPINRATAAAWDLAMAFHVAGEAARDLAAGFRLAVPVAAEWAARQLVGNLLRDLTLKRYHRLRRQLIAKARGKNWRSVR